MLSAGEYYCERMGPSDKETPPEHTALPFPPGERSFSGSPDRFGGLVVNLDGAPFVCKCGGVYRYRAVDVAMPERKRESSDMRIAWLLEQAKKTMDRTAYSEFAQMIEDCQNDRSLVLPMTGEIILLQASIFFDLGMKYEAGKARA